MNLKMLKAKLHRATVTDANPNYVGSITIDRDLMDAVGILEYEAVLICDVTNGARSETYVLEGKRGSGIICVNGASAKIINKGDIVIILCFEYLLKDEAADNEPKMILLDENNRVVKKL
jgi:aspartate 1-decarboxylase